MTHPTAGPVSRARAGFTLIEMMMAILLTMLVFAITIPFFRQQTMAVDNSAGRLDALQNARYAQSYIDRELRLAGGITGQPIIVQAAAFAITFNVDLVSRQAGDPNATYYNPSADSLSTESWQPSRAKALPTSAVLYPTQFYLDGSGIQSPAETISYFLYLDGTQSRTDLYVLYRRVNDRDSTVIARNIWIPVDTAYFFKYSRTNATGTITAIPQASLPVYWNTANDPADSIRVVTMRVAGLYRDVRRSMDVTRTVYYNTRLLNAGMLKQSLCGDPPLPPLLPVATKVADSTGHTMSVHLTWNASLEEAGGEKDVALYMLQRRPLAGVDWEVLGNVVAQGLASYSFDDFNPVSASSWVYGVVAQDCTPSNSTVAATATVINP